MVRCKPKIYLKKVLSSRRTTFKKLAHNRKDSHIHQNLASKHDETEQPHHTAPPSR